MASLVSIPALNGVYVGNVESGPSGVLHIGLQCPNPPSAGFLKIEGSPYNAPTKWRTIGGASALDLSQLAAGPIYASDYGHYSKLRFTVTGISGGSTAIAAAVNLMPAAGFPDDAFMGFRALTVQGFVESNSKWGTQFFTNIALGSIAANTTYKIAFATAGQTVLVDDRSMYALGAAVGLQIFKQPTGVTGGTNVPVQNYNDVNPAATTVTVTKGVTTTSDGTAWGDQTHLWGANSVAQRTGSGIVPGGNRVLKKNSSYLIVIQNQDNAAALIDYYLSWYEGDPDLPRS